MRSESHLYVNYIAARTIRAGEEILISQAAVWPRDGDIVDGRALTGGAPNDVVRVRLYPPFREPEPRTIENDPVLYAIAVIESYQMDIRNTTVHGHIQFNNGDEIGGMPSTLADLGFCQGSIYTGAIDHIKRMAGVV